MAGNPYFDQPLVPVRPRMFRNIGAKIVWTLVPLVTLGLAAAVPFVVAAAKGVVKPWLAVTYVVGEAAVFLTAYTISPDTKDDSPVPGLLLIFLMITAATHTALLDNERVGVGK
ncbi:hypothetical protein [Streptomyces sp. NPDC001781]